MRCIINVAIGGRYPKEQQRLGNSLAKHFDGDFLHWSDFPNDNYNKENKYNAKAAAFEEAIKKGYKQILWVDSPVVALKAVGPIFDFIKEKGYLTMKNDNYNCAETSNDKSLEYFKVTRDQAANFQEHAGGIIGIDMENPKGKQLIELFIQACKEGIADGSRNHDGQSKDPRFKFHRQCQTVISLAANKLGLPYTMEWDKGMIALRPNKRTDKTILCWSHRSGVTLPDTDRGYTRRQLSKGGTRKTKNGKNGYIYLCTKGGLNDCLVQLAICTDYAIKHNRSIILEFTTYSATDLNKVFNFSKFPVPILTNYKEMQEKLKLKPIEPPYIKSLKQIPGFRGFKEDISYTRGNFVDKTGRILQFDLTKSYPSNKVLVYANGGGGAGDSAVNILKHIRLRPAVIAAYKQKLKDYNIPEEYNSIHLRATDRSLNISNNITGMRLKDSDAIIKAPSSGDQHIDSIKKIDAFMNVSDLPVFISGDNRQLVDTLTKQYPRVTQSNIHSRCEASGTRAPLHRQGSKDPGNLKNAIVDLLILSGAKAIMTSAGGYSRLAKKLLAKKDIREELLS
jgi:hypothetical protein